MSEQRVLVDYLGLSFKDYSKKDYLIEYLHLPVDEMQVKYSARNYEYCVCYGGSVWLHWTSPECQFSKANTGCFLELTGQGCRLIESWNNNFDWFFFLYQFQDLIHTEVKLGDNIGHACKITRLDVACDLLDDDLTTVPFLHNCAVKKCYKCLAKPKDGHFNYDINNIDSFYFGNHRQSHRFLRIYDKALEQANKYDNAALSEMKWVRFELCMRDECAYSFYANLVECLGDWVACYYGVMRDFITFTNESKDDVGGHTERMTAAAWWEDFLQSLLKLKQIYLPGNDYTINRLRNHIKRFYSSSIKAMLLYNNGDLYELMQFINDSKLSQKQRDLLRKCGINIDSQRPPD